MKIRKWKWGSTILTLCMLLSLMPMKANAAEATMVNVDWQLLYSSTPFLVNGTAAAEGVLGEDGCTAYFDAESSMLILQGATLTDSIRCDDDMTLKLLDTNTVDGSIFVSGALTVEGPGTLQITTDERAFDVRETLTINGGTITMDGTLGWRDKPLMVGRTGVTINSGTVSSSNARNAYAIDCYENGVITVNGGL